MPIDWSLLTALADQAAKLIKTIKDRKLEANDRAAEYFTDLGTALEAIATKLRNGELPRVAGNKYNQLVFQFDDCTSEIAKTMDERRYTMFRELSRLGVLAKNLDWYLLNDDKQLSQSERDRWLAEIERGAGKLQALGTILRTKSR